MRVKKHICLTEATSLSAFLFLSTMYKFTYLFTYSLTYLNNRKTAEEVDSETDDGMLLSPIKQSILGYVFTD